MYGEDVLEHMARTFFVLAWADAVEEAGYRFPGGTELFEAAPPTTDGARKCAKNLYDEIEKTNGVDLETFIPPPHTEDTYTSREQEMFGYYLVMESLGHGVAWTDDRDDDHGLDLPYADDYEGRFEGDPVIDKSVQAVQDGLDPYAYLEEDDIDNSGDVENFLGGLD